MAWEKVPIDEPIQAPSLYNKVRNFKIPLTAEYGLGILEESEPNNYVKIGEATFSRNSIATLAGKIYGINEPRQDAARGTLISPQATNLFTPDSMWMGGTDGRWTVTQYSTQHVELEYNITQLSGVSDIAQKYCYRGLSIPIVVGDVRYITFVYKLDTSLTYFSTTSQLSPSINIVNGLPDPNSRVRDNSEWIDYEVTENDFVVVRVKVTVLSTGGVSACRAYFNSLPSTPETYQMGIVQVSETLSEYIPTTSTEETQGADNLSVPSSLLGDGDFTIAGTAIDLNVTNLDHLFGASNGASYCNLRANLISNQLELFYANRVLRLNNTEFRCLRFVFTRTANRLYLATQYGDAQLNISSPPPDFSPLYIGANEAGARQNNAFNNDFRISQRAWSQGEIDAYRFS
jgi:hypothetical protein